jgi:hypothetical protein
MANAYVIEDIAELNDEPRGFTLRLVRINLLARTPEQHIGAIAQRLRNHARSIAERYVDNTDHVRGILQLVNPANNARRAGSKSISINEITPEKIEELLDMIAQSNEDIDFQDVEYEFHFRIFD